MEVRFQRANHRTGNESVVLKFSGAVDGQTACVLVDSGCDVDVSSLLDEDEHLACVLLTHAHLDHFRSLGANVVDGAPVLAAAPTAAVLETALAENKRNERVLGDVDAAIDAVEGISGWRTILGDGAVRVHPVPAGHAPGAAGFVVQFRDGDVARNILVTGDFLRTTVAGYPAIPASLPLDVEAMVVNVSTTTNYEAAFEDAVETILGRVTEGFTTLVTTGGLQGVHVGRVLAAAVDRWSLGVDVCLVGQSAKLWADLELPTDDVHLRPEYADPEAVLEAGMVTIAGPETPVDGSARRLFDVIRDRGDAALVQVTTGALHPVTAGACSTDAFEVRPHPTEGVVDDLVEGYDPLHVVVAHETGPALDAYKDKYASFVWANQDAFEQTLFADGEWQAPPWVSERAERYVYGNTTEYGGNPIDDEHVLDVSLPAVVPGDVSLHAEGLDDVRLGARFGGHDIDTADATPVDVDDGDPTLCDVLARLEDIDAKLDATPTVYSDVAVAVRFVDGETHLVLPEDVALDDRADLTVRVPDAALAADSDTADADSDDQDD